jgi:excisionase family DNA binding protein
VSDLLSVADVARITGLSEYTIRAAVRDCDLAATKLRGRIRIHPDGLAAWIDENRVTPTIGAEMLLGQRPAAPSPRTPSDMDPREAVRRRRTAA